MKKYSFIEALKDSNKEEMKKYFKADLHNHAVFSFDKTHLHKNNITIPKTKKVNSLTSFKNFAHKYIRPLQNDKNSLSILLGGTFEKCLQSGIVKVDTNIGYKICINAFNNNINKFINFLNKFKYKNLEIRWIIDISRDGYLEEHEQLILKLINSKFFYGIDLTSTENYTPNNKFLKIYNIANQNGLITKVHCGEQLGAEYIRQCIIDFNPKQIQHGINIVESRKTMQLAKKRGLIFNVCPSSNLLLKFVKTLQNHPISKMIDYGLNVTIGTDDYLLTENDINDEYLKLYKHNILSAKQLDKIRKFSLTL